MNNVFENKLSMYQKIQAFLTLHTTDTSSIAAVATLKTEFDLLVGKILSSAGLSSIDITGYTVLKNNKRIEVTKALLKVSTAYTAWARMNSKPQEAEKTDLTPAMLNSMRDNDFYTYSQQVHLIATSVPIATLTPFGILAADLSSLSTKNGEFLALIQEPRLRIGERSAEFSNLERLFEQTDELLKLKLDNVMPIFQVNNPTLYAAYTNARGIDDTGAIVAADYEGSVPISTIQLIATIPYLISRTFYIKNTGSTAFTFGISTNTTSLEGTPVSVAPGSEVQRLSSNLGATGDNILINNTESSMGASYEIRIIE
jgi:hypothetical protein